MDTPIKNADDWQQLLQAGEDGNGAVQMEIAWHYNSGLTVDGVELAAADEQLEYEWTKRAYESGNGEAVERYANQLSSGKYCTKDTALAMQLYREAIKAGSSNAANSLGIEYRDQHDYRKAFRYYKKAGSEYLALGMCYYYGVGVSRNRFKAFRFFRNTLKTERCLSAYERDELNYMIGRMYLEGEAVKRSLRKARHYLLLANEDGDHRSADQLLCIIGMKDRVDMRRSDCE